MAHDPLTYCELLEWYLTARDADCGVRSSYVEQVARLGGRGRFRPEHEFHAETGFAKDRVMRRRWTQLDPHSRDVLSAHYTASAPIGTFGKCTAECRCMTHGFSRFPRGFESTLGKFAGIALFLAECEGTVLALFRACESGGSLISPFKKSAEAACRAAHSAYYAIAQRDGDQDLVGHPLAGMFAHEVIQEDWPRNVGGIWKQRS